MRFQLIDRTFLAHPKRYIFQSLLAVIAVMALLYFLEAFTHAAIVAALGATTFIVFAMPKTVAAEPRRLIGGHFVGIISGLICYFALHTGPLSHYFTTDEIIHWLPEALAVGLSIFLMTALNFEHPPAAGTALGIVTHEWTIQTILFIMIFSTSLALIGFLLRKYLKNLST